jgi:hypothetical protein
MRKIKQRYSNIRIALHKMLIVYKKAGLVFADG